MLVTSEQAVELLIAGKVVALPTETVYGLAAKLTEPSAIAEIYRLKKRPQDNPLIIHLLSANDLDPFLKQQPPPFTQELTTRFWPGPLTLVLPVQESEVPLIARANQPTAAFRVPNHPQMREVLALTGPLVAPSANLSGKPSPTSAQHVLTDFHHNVSVVDGGPCSEGVESTILIYQENSWHIARLGAIPPEEFRPTLGYHPQRLTNPLHCPGNRHKHYAPQAKLILGRSKYAREAEVVIGFTDRSYPDAKTILYLGNSEDPSSALQNLYLLLRKLDEKKFFNAWIDLNIPHDGAWSTIHERLERAAL